MKNTPTIILLFILLALEGCFTTYNYKPLSIEVMIPAKEYFPVGDSSITTYYYNSNYNTGSLINRYYLNGKIILDTLQADSLASVIYYNSFVDSLRKQNSFDSITDLGLTFPKIGKDSIAIFGSSAIDSIYKMHPFDNLCSLTQFKINNLVRTFYAEDYVEIKFIITSLWAIYSPLGLDYIVLNSDSVMYSIPIYEFSQEKFINYDRRMLLKEASADIGYKFAGSMSPHWEKAERLYYNSGNYQFQQADKYALNNEWLKAAEVWKELTKNKNKNIAAKSMYNMAIACEMRSDYDAAIDWVTRSFQIFGKKNAFHAKNCMDYIEILATRKLEAEKIQEQLGLPDNDY